MAKKKSAVTESPVPIQMLDLESVRPNDWNPNAVSREQQVSIQKEIERLGGLPHPIIVRKADRPGRYEIVDGEQRWRAARTLGHEKVPAQVVEIDDLEAMRQTFKRNEHGTMCPLQTGRLFVRMMSGSGKEQSQRRFAVENNLDEATLRNYLLYVRAAEQRSAHLGDADKADAEVKALTVRQVRRYVELPASQRDRWLESGAPMREAEGARASKGVTKPGAARQTDPVGEIMALFARCDPAQRDDLLGRLAADESVRAAMRRHSAPARRRA